LRIVRVVLVIAAVAGAFVLGHVTAAPQIAQAQTPVPVTTAVLAHFHCYAAQFGPQLNPVQVALHDQFETSEAVVSRPEFFCAPVTETLLRQKAVPFDGAADHLVCCYAPGGTAIAQNHTAVNQFGKMTAANLVPRMDCVPTHQDE
jgi:hypothetical protein